MRSTFLIVYIKLIFTAYLTCTNAQTIRDAIFINFFGSHDRCEPNICGLNAKCSVIGKIFSCTCSIGFEGDPFKSCFIINPCKSNPCGINADCRARGKVPVCTCPNGYQGDPHLNCTTAVCPGGCGHGKCTSPKICTCYQGYTGPACEIDVSDHTSCQPNPCGINANSRARGRVPVCTCPNKYQGDPHFNSTPVVSDRTSCQPNPCGLNTLCRANGNVATCSCFIGYVRDSVNSCIIRQICEPNPCGINADCRAHGKVPVCTCPNGFVGDPHFNCTTVLARDYSSTGAGCDIIGGVSLAGQCLLFSTEKLSWNDAKEKCSSQNARLAVPNDPQAFLSYAGSNYKDTGFWLGASDIANEGSWFWLDGRPLDKLDKSVWRHGEPNNAFENEDCLRSNSDAPCHYLERYVCVKEVLLDGFSCPQTQSQSRAVDPNQDHQLYINPEDCRSYYICYYGIKPVLFSCPDGAVFNEFTLICDQPFNVEGCEDYYAAKNTVPASSVVPLA